MGCSPIKKVDLKSGVNEKNDKKGKSSQINELFYNRFR
jgi:hypothetical protein